MILRTSKQPVIKSQKDPPCIRLSKKHQLCTGKIVVV